ncbi:MAG TPA: ferritin-like domain-containing protein [Myxococcales bacterium]|nr:ferritin-like domain-containing protein [Myxococcales bacterium]
MIPPLAAQAWEFRARVERDAAVRFARLAEEIAAFDAGSPVPALMRKAAEDERRHELLCAELAGTSTSAAGETRLAPRSFGPRAAALYDTVAACCIAETESVATVTSLLAEDVGPRVREVLHEIARDEVVHAQMGWAHLAREAAAIDVTFLSAFIPAMLAGTAGDLFTAAGPEEDLRRFGVLPASRRREIFVQTLREVVFPGLEQCGLSARPACEWLEASLTSRTAAGSTG